MRALTIKAWTGLGPIRSIRGGLLFMTILAVTPLMLFASGMALLRAGEANHLPTAAAWVSVAAVPVLIAVSAVVIVGIASEAMVMEWLFYLERLSRAYARGRYSLRPQRLKQAPLEFRRLGEAVEDMASAVEHRDQALRDALREQTVLLREVHHRVKNNLQIVGSLLSLQSARAKDPAIKEALQDAMVRIDAVSLSQRFMQQEEEEDRVCSVELFEAFAGLIRGRLGSGRRALVLSTQIEPGDLPLDTGSRLVSIAAEAVVCALRGSQSNPVLCHLIVSFSADKVEMALTVQNEPDAFANSPDQVCLDLIGGYVRQLKGRIMTGDGALSVSAPRGWPGPAQRHATDAQEKKFFRILDRTQGRLAS